MWCENDVKSGAAEDTTARRPTSRGETTARDSRGVIGSLSGDNWMANKLIGNRLRVMGRGGGMGLLTFSPPWQRALQARMRGWALMMGREREGVLHSEGVAGL